MREIKYRALDKETNEWCVGSLKPKNNEVRMDAFWSYYFNDLLDKKTLGQYAEFKNKNDEEIYGGDIVNTGGTDNGVIVYELCEFLVRFSETLCRKLNVDMHNEIEIIGNIHKNPELIK